MLQPYKVDFPGKGFKRILLIAGVHGNELTPIKVLIQLAQNIKDQDISFKQLTIYIGANPYALEAGTRDGKYEETKDLNRSFHTKIEYQKNLKELIDSHDIILDIHSSPRCCPLILIDNNSLAISMKDWCIQNNLVFACRNSTKDTIKKYCLDNNKIGLTVELKGMRITELNHILEGHIFLENILNNINKLKLKDNTDRFIYPWNELLAPVEGIVHFSPNILGYQVNQNQSLGYITDLSGLIINEICSPIQGTIVDLINTDYVKIDQVLAYIQPD